MSAIFKLKNSETEYTGKISNYTKQICCMKL